VFRQEKIPQLDYETYFQRGTLWNLVRRGNPYHFVQTYQAMRRAYGYQLHYVNFGYWTEGIDTVEPARQMTLRIGEALGLREGQRLLEAGSGLGQASCDMLRAFRLEQILGMNISAAQVRFATDLVAAYGLQDRISHKEIDACDHVHALEPGSFDHAMAQECLGLFRDSPGFLAGLNRLLPEGGRFAATVVTSPRPPGRLLAGSQRLFFEVVPCAMSVWEQRCRDAGFTKFEAINITDLVFKPMFAQLDRTLAAPEAWDFIHGSLRRPLRALIDQAREGVEGDYMRYELFVAEC